ncbi:tetratricopeptide repeat protein [Wenzhouxiangella sp. XN24]|uniref:tetratricopeptide repeat protein n=1 Tax=Wenzhouxiangella sp. XN24 TaxID=2713569 RepID=UPI0013EB68F2|nr:tetratricopeptide repeat protein [Wenzhouxiangella sp. XN24]NGX15674.1 tetratricopeptide repeat protein [Wenzhouxiangella sp. XN24]
MLSNCCASDLRGLPMIRRAPAGTALMAMLLLAGCGTLPGAGSGDDLSADPRFDRATHALQAGVADEAEQLLDGLATDYPELSGPLLNLGILHAAAGRLEAAEAAFRQVLEMAPADAVAHAELGIVLRRQGRFAEADASYREALALQPDYALAWRNRGVLLDLYLGRPAEALQCYERYLDLVGGLEGDEQVARWVAELQLRSNSRVATR